MRKILIVSVAFMVGCTSAEKKFNLDIENKNCESALEKIPENGTGAKFLSKTQQAGGVAVSYALTGAAYTTEVLVDIVGGTVMFLALCSPGILAETFATATSSPQNPEFKPCLPGNLGALSAPPLGRKTYRTSKNLRCPNLVGMSQSIRKVASCYEKRGAPEDLKKAKQTLEAIQFSLDFYDCLPDDERKNIDNQVARLKAN